MIGSVFDPWELATYVAGVAVAVVGAIAEGERVAVEVESKGDLRNGRQYRQQYHFAITLRDGKITAVHEYLDTLHVHDVWMRA